MGHPQQEPTLSPAGYPAPPPSGRSTEGSQSQMEGLWKGLVGRNQWNQPNYSNKNELSGSGAENYLNDHVLYKLFISMSLDGVERALQLVARVPRPSFGHNVDCLWALLNLSFLIWKKGMIVHSSLDWKEITCKKVLWKLPLPYKCRMLLWFHDTTANLKRSVHKYRRASRNGTVYSMLWKR